MMLMMLLNGTIVNIFCHNMQIFPIKTHGIEISVFLFVILCWCPSLEYRSVVVNANVFFCFFYGSNVDFEDHFLLLSDEKVRIEGNYKSHIVFV